MKRANLVWDEDNLRDYIKDPQAKVKGNRMPYGGLSDPKDVDDVVAYLKDLKERSARSPLYRAAWGPPGENAGGGGEEGPPHPKTTLGRLSPRGEQGDASGLDCHPP